MKCQICKKNDAQIVFTQIVNNEKVVLQICTECAREKGLTIEMPAAPSMTSQPGDVFPDFKNSGARDEDADMPDVACEVCGLDFAEFRRSGLFGCDRCHEYFGDHLKKLLKQIHGTDVHQIQASAPEQKKTPPKKNVRTVLRELKTELEKCVVNEEYERAAELRDRILELEKGGA